jgi:putative exporter of polyketide antibiotics
MDSTFRFVQVKYTVFWVQMGPGRPQPFVSCSACCEPMLVMSSCSEVIPGMMPLPCTVALPMYPGMVSIFYSALVTLQLRSEEVAGRAELLLSTPVGRVRWIASHLLFALPGTVIVLAAGGFFLGLVRGLSSGDIAVFPRVFAGTLLHAPAAWVLIGVALLLFGIAPRFAVAMTWVALLYVQLIGEVLGPILLGPTYRYWVINALQPFYWVPRITSGGHSLLHRSFCS